MHEGHRKRMEERLRSDPDGLCDHELLEILLFYAIPRKNTNPLAHSLIDSFGSLEAVLKGTYEQFLAVDGVGPSTAAFLVALSCVRARLPQKGKEEPPAVFNVREFSKFLPGRFGAEETEVIEIYCLDAREHITFTKRFVSAERDRANVDTEALSGFVAAQHPFGIVIAHNHPAAPAIPSAADDAFTARLQVLCELHGVRLFDHFIVGQNGLFSYFSSGKLEEIKKRYSFANLIGGRL